MPSYYRDPRAPAPNVPRRVGTTALIEREGSFLLERRRDDGSWGFVGGRVEDDETVLAALHREVLEETGLHIAQSTLFGIFSDPTRVVSYPDGNVWQVLSIVFLVVPVEGDEPVASDESLELRWVSRGELGRLELWPVHRPIRDAWLAGPAGVVVA